MSREGFMTLLEKKTAALYKGMIEDEEIPND